MNNAFQIQTMTGQYWLDIVVALAEKDAIIAAKDAEIATLQPGYVAPEPPTVEKQFADAIAAVIESLPEEEKAIYAEAVAAISFTPKVKPVEEKPLDIGPIEIVEP
jgi:hypothetical protein